MPVHVDTNLKKENGNVSHYGCGTMLTCSAQQDGILFTNLLILNLFDLTLLYMIKIYQNNMPQVACEGSNYIRVCFDSESIASFCFAPKHEFC